MGNYLPDSCPKFQFVYFCKKSRLLHVLIFLLSTLLFTGISAQNITNRQIPNKSWTTNNPFKTDVFVENYGQFNTWAPSKLPIKYAINNSDKRFFTQQGLIFRLDKFENIAE